MDLIKSGSVVLLLILVVFGTLLYTWGMGWKWIVMGLFTVLIGFFVMMRD